MKKFIVQLNVYCAIALFGMCVSYPALSGVLKASAALYA